MNFLGPSFSVELSSLLVRNVSYEIPSLKKQIAKCQQLQQEYSRKEEEGQAGAAEMREQFYHSCKQYGLTVSRPAGSPAAGGHMPGASVLSGFWGGLSFPSLPLGPFLGQFLAHLESSGIFFNPLNSTSPHFCLSPPCGSSLGGQCPKRTTGPGEGPTQSAGRDRGGGPGPGRSHRPVPGLCGVRV